MIVSRINLEDKETVLELEKRKRELSKAKIESGYGLEDFALITATNYIEEDHIDKPLSRIPFVLRLNSSAAQAIRDILIKEGNINLSSMTTDEYLAFNKSIEEYFPLSTQYRSTIHYTLNGLVRTHSPMKGDFDERNFVIISKLSNHIGKDDIRNLAMQDTFISGNVEIPNDSLVLVNEEKYYELIKKYPWLDTYNLVLYKGSQELAVHYVLTDMRIMPEIIEAHNARYSERFELYFTFLKDLGKRYGFVAGGSHYYSNENRDDDDKNRELWKIYDKNFYIKLFKYFNTDKEVVDRMFGLFEHENYNSCNNKIREALIDFIYSIGVERYIEFVKKYNQDIMDAIKLGKYPNNDEILASRGIILKDEKNTSLSI